MRFTVVGVYLALAMHVVAGVLTVPLFAHAFGAEGYGFWGALLGITAYLSPLNLGVSQTVSSRISTTPNATREEVGRVIGLGFTLYVRACAAGACVVLPIALLIPWDELFRLGATSANEARAIAGLVAATFLAELPFSVFRAALGGLGKLGVERMVGVVSLALRLGAAYLFTVLPVPLWAAVVVLSLTNFVGHFACLGYLIRREGIRVRLAWRVPEALTAEVPSFRRTGLWYLAIQLTAAVLWGTDPLLAGLLEDATASARISVAWRAVALVMNLGTALGPAVGPMLARRWAQGLSAQTAAAADISTRVVAGVITGGLVSFLGVADVFFPLWLGDPALIPERSVVVAYVVVCIVWGWLIVPEAFLVQAGQHRPFAIGSIVEAGLKLGFSLLFASQWGIAGMPLGTLAARCLTSLWLLPQQYSLAASTPWPRFVVLVAGASVLPGVACYGTQAAARAGWMGAAGTTVWASTLLGAAVFVAVYVAVGMPPEMRRAARAFITRQQS